MGLSVTDKFMQIVPNFSSYLLQIGLFKQYVRFTSCMYKNSVLDLPAGCYRYVIQKCVWITSWLLQVSYVYQIYQLAVTDQLYKKCVRFTSWLLQISSANSVRFTSWLLQVRYTKVCQIYQLVVTDVSQIVSDLPAVHYR